MSRAELQRAAAAVLDGVRDRHLLLLCDFDGTLCEFDPDPAAVRLPDHRRELLLQIGRLPRTTIGIVSGRRLEDVRERSRLGPEAFYAGLHGLEIEGGGESFVHPAVAESTELLQSLAATLSADFAGLEGVFIENKGLSLAAHYRESPSVAARVRGRVELVARPYLEAGRIRIMHGDCMIELLPNIDWNKGSAVRWIGERVEARHGPVWTVYAGDDVTDDDALRVVRGRGVAVAASRRASAGEFVLDGPAEIEAWLEAILSSRPSAAGRQSGRS